MSTWQAQAGPQELFLRLVLDQSDNAPDEIFYGGAAGGGKTDSILLAQIIYCQTYPEIRCLFLRKTYKALEARPIPRSKELLIGIAKYNESKHTWIFPNGSVLEFGCLEHKGTEDKYQGGEYALIGFDELTQFEEYQYLYLLTRNRTSKFALDGLRIRCKIISGANPGGRGHQWVKRRFVNAGQFKLHVAPQTEEEKRLGLAPRRRIFIPAKLRDNKILMTASPEYEANLLAIPNENLRRALYDGDWDIFEGQAFPEWRAEKNGRPWHVVPPFTIPANAKRWRSGDWGYTKPFCFLWFARLDDGLIYVYREYYGTVPGQPDTGIKLQASEVGQRIHALERDDGKVGIGYLDPACFNKQGHDAPTIAESLRGTKEWQGAYFEPAHNDRINGKNRIHELLAEDPELHLPKLRIFATCINLIRTLPELPLDETFVEDVDTDAEDHAYDALRYGLYRRIGKPVTAEEQQSRDARRKEATKPRFEKTGY